MTTNAPVSTSGSATNVTPGAGALGFPTIDLNAALSGQLLADALLIGLPFDGGVHGVPGQRHGPEILRNCGPAQPWQVNESNALFGVWDPVKRQHVLQGKRVFDAGDLGRVPIDPRRTRADYYAAAVKLGTAVGALDSLPIFIGGDHSITAPIVHGLAARHKGIDVIAFDAHCDFSARAMPTLDDITHADFLGHLLQNELVENVDIYGVRTFLPEDCLPQPESLACHTDINDAYWPRSHDNPVVLSVDLDVLDPLHFPATGHPEAGGCALRDLIPVVSHIASHPRLIAVDIVEPILDDHNNPTTAAAIAALIMAVLRGRFGESP